jgi:hypothetical protein
MLRKFWEQLKRAGWHGVTIFVLGLASLINLIIDLVEFTKFRLGYH